MIFFGTFNGQKIYGRILAAELLEKIGLPDTSPTPPAL
jgi:hypothetical protein